MKRTKHKIKELRRLVKLCGGTIPLPGCHHAWGMTVETDDGTLWVKDNADHVICYSREVLRERAVDVRYIWRSDRWFWLTLENLREIESEVFPTEAAALIAGLEATE